MNDGLPYYDCAIAGGGLAGLSLAARLARSGFRTVLFEKNGYPFHKVCGEYLSGESLSSLAELGVPLETWELPRIDRLLVSGPGGILVNRPLRPGGVGVSRFRLDHGLARAARESGADLLENTKVEDVRCRDDSFIVENSRGRVQAAVCCGAFGRHATLDVKWHRRGAWRKYSGKQAFRQKPGFIGVKYHVLLERPRNTIELHHFKNGYCGISPVEDGRHCICYLTSEQNLRDQGNDLGRLQEKVLAANPFLRKAFGEAVMLYKRPLTVSRISFVRKSLVENNVLMLGDAAGMIAPLCGNGMSMALHAGKLAFPLIADFLRKKITREEMGRAWQSQWATTFGNRMRAGRIIQALFQQPATAGLLLRSLRPFPGIIDLMVKQTHGRESF